MTAMSAKAGGGAQNVVEARPPSSLLPSPVFCFMVRAEGWEKWRQKGQGGNRDGPDDVLWLRTVAAVSHQC